MCATRVALVRRRGSLHRRGAHHRETYFLSPFDFQTRRAMFVSGPFYRFSKHFRVNYDQALRRGGLLSQFSRNRSGHFKQASFDLFRSGESDGECYRTRFGREHLYRSPPSLAQTQPPNTRSPVSPTHFSSGNPQ